MKYTGLYDHIEQTPVVIAKVKKTGIEVTVARTRDFCTTSGKCIYWYDVIPRINNQGFWEDDLDFSN